LVTSIGLIESLSTILFLNLIPDCSEDINRNNVECCLHEKNNTGKRKNSIL
jgi:hypothetical protein